MQELEDELEQARATMTALRRKLKETMDWARNQALRTWEVSNQTKSRRRRRIEIKYKVKLEKLK